MTIDYNFGVTPTWVMPTEESFNVITTESENLKKEYYLLSSTPRRQYTLKFDGLSDANFATVLDFYRDVSGQYMEFNWNTVPLYINGGAGAGVTMAGRWVDKPKWTPESNSWNVELIFEKSI